MNSKKISYKTSLRPHNCQISLMYFCFMIRNVLIFVIRDKTDGFEKKTLSARRQNNGVGFYLPTDYSHLSSI